jgi:hypothetical protein
LIVLPAIVRLVGGLSAGDFVEDLVGGFGPDEGLGVVVPVGDPVRSRPYLVPERMTLCPRTLVAMLAVPSDSAFLDA